MRKAQRGLRRWDTPPGQPNVHFSAVDGQCRWVLGLDVSEGEAGLRRLGRALYEAACAFYLGDARRRLALHAERRNPSPTTSTRVAFKVR